MKPVNAILSGYGTTVFTVMSALAVEHGAINLGQGFPDTEGPEDVRRVAAEAVGGDAVALTVPPALRPGRSDLGSRRELFSR